MNSDYFHTYPLLFPLHLHDLMHCKPFTHIHMFVCDSLSLTEADGMTKSLLLYFGA